MTARRRAQALQGLRRGAAIAALVGMALRGVAHAEPPQASPVVSAPEASPILSAPAASPFVPRSGPELNLGVGPLLYPAYPGARTYRVVPFPNISGGWGDRVDFDLLDGLTVSAVEAGGFSAGPAARWRFGRVTSDDRRQLTGLRSVGDTLELGGFVAYEHGPLSLDVTGTQDVARQHRGAVLDTRLLLAAPIGRVALQAGPELRLVTRPYAEAFYGIGPDQAAASGRPAYTAKAGLERAGALLSAEWRITDRLSLKGFVEYGRLLGSARHSPIVAGPGGSPDQVYAAAFLTWRLW